MVSRRFVRNALTPKISTPRVSAIATLPLDQDGLYVVAQVTHRGDTRENLWETEVVGYSLQYTTDLPLGIFGGDSNAGGGA